LFVDSQPAGATIYLNGKTQRSTTAARLILPAGAYDLTIKKDGYRTWQRSFNLTEHQIARYVYPFLFPQNPRIKSLKSYSDTPSFMSESLDRHWLLIEPPAQVPGGITFDEFDTTSVDKPPKVLAIPNDLLSTATQPDDIFKEIEWSTDNKHLLLEHSYLGGSEFIVFNRDNPAESINVNKLFSLNPTLVAMRDKKIAQLYLYNQTTTNLDIGDTASSTITPLLKHVLAFKSNGPDLINYVSDQGLPAGQVSADIWDGSKSYQMYTFAAGSQYLIDEAKYQNHWYYVAGSDTGERVNIYKDPLNSLKDSAVAKAVPLLSLNISGATKVSFSTNARFIEAQAGQSFSVYDFETQSLYRYTLKEALADPLHWMDGHRLIGKSNETIFVMDYDSTNRQAVTSTTFTGGGFFDPDFKYLFTTTPASNESNVNFELVDMRAGTDLPKQ
ncbi:MAG TPA: PEGA domain-containing protein, partial [Candidatus Saccharimonadales bacterium]|nr:PEGA domain-containing protein [Candidatus Saccharimonadales bacterium]